MNKNGPPGLSPDAVSRHLRRTWIQTILGIALLAVLSTSSLYFLGLHWSFTGLILMAWVLLPLWGWYKSADMVKKLMHCHEPSPFDMRHARLVTIVDRLFPRTGLPVKPAVYVSPLPVPNAFATGRNPQNSFICATEGLLRMDLTDQELEGIVAHELAHVKSRDVTITSMTAVLGSLLTIILAQGLPGIFRPVFDTESSGNLLSRLDRKVKKDRKRFFAAGGGIAGLALFVVIFFLVSMFSRLVSMFVSRARESHADVLAAHWTGNPCSLSSALQKISNWLSINMIDIRMQMLLSGLSPLLLVSPLDNENGDTENGENSQNSRLRHWWQRLGQNHPPVPERLAMLDELAGSSCPRIK